MTLYFVAYHDTHHLYSETFSTPEDAAEWLQRAQGCYGSEIKGAYVMSGEEMALNDAIDILLRAVRVAA